MTSRSRHGLKHGYRSGLEEKIANELKAAGIPARYEQIKVRYEKPAKASTYTPDFVIDCPDRVCPECKGVGRLEDWYDGGKCCSLFDCPTCKHKKRIPHQIIIETKGRFVTADRLKHIEIKKQHPHLDIRFVFQNSRQRIAKTSKTTYAAWCDRHGFQYADKTIPESWLEEARK